MSQDVTRPTSNPSDAHPVAPVESGGVDTNGAPRGEPTKTGMTYASKLPPDHPGLKLDVAQPRSLRKGPTLVALAVLLGAVGLAVVVAVSPRGSDQAKAAMPSLPESPAKTITIAEAVRSRPGNDAPLHPPSSAPPRLGPPLHGDAADPTAGAGSSFGSPPSTPIDSARQALRDERQKALGSPILVELENPVQAEQGVGSPTAAGGAAAAAATGAGPSAPLPSGLGGGSGDPNMQQRKNDFLSRDGVNTSSYLSDPLVAPRSPYEVKAGTIIPTTLITGIDSDLPGQIVGQVRENVYDTVTGNYLLVPQGSRLIATYDSMVGFGQERVLVCWNRLIRPDGISITLECMPGVDLAGYAGFADDVDHHWWRILSGVALGTLLSATAQRSQGDVTGYQPTIPQLWASNVGGTINQAGQQITQKNLQIQPTIKVRPGFTVNVLVTKDIVIPPYTQQGVSR